MKGIRVLYFNEHAILVEIHVHPIRCISVLFSTLYFVP